MTNGIAWWVCGFWLLPDYYLFSHNHFVLILFRQPNAIAFILIRHLFWIDIYLVSYYI